MTAGVKIFRSTDAGAAVLSGTAGALITLLDAVLVNGQNSKTVTITRSASTATATATAHGFLAGQKIVVSGANETEYNIEAYISNVAANTFDYTVSGTPATPATGTITAKQASAGWAKEFSGTNLAAYRPPAGGNRLRLRIDDTGTTNGRGVGYETMSDVNTGTGDFPTAAQISGGLYWPKSNTADATARPWIIAATDRLIIMHVSSSSIANATNASICVFGDIKSFKSGDAYSTIHIAGTITTTTASNILSLVSTSLGNTASGHYISRSYTQLGTSLNVGKHIDSAKAMSTVSIGSVTSTLVYPNGPDGGLYMSSIWIHEISGPHVRGTIPGLWAPLHNKPLEHLDTVSGTGALAGKTFQALKMYNGSECLLELSDTWDTV
ncbi:hypothetical protein BH20PSE1_BH20PSE1_01000 [soil metagenome]